ncbi:MAG: DUF938 domain-containing protein [Brevundimonas sp.]
MRYVTVMQTMDPLSSSSGAARSSPAADRNADAILEVLRAALPRQGRVLEIAAGTGQHAARFAAALPGLVWTPTDASADALSSIAAWRASARADNLAAPIRLVVEDQASWPDGPFSAVVAINLIHISPWAATEALMAGAARVLAPGGLLYLYGPYREADGPLAESNAAFDDSLRARDPAWGLRDRDAVIEAAKANGLAFTLRKAMPANNLSLLFRKV